METDDTALSEEQAYWLRRVLESRPKAVLVDTFAIPDGIRDLLAARGLIRSHHRSGVEITIDGIRTIARHKPFQDPKS